MHFPSSAARLRCALGACVLGISLLSSCDPWDGIAIFTKNTPPPKVPAHVVALRDLVYIERDERALELDLYIPSDVPAPMPTVVYVHGGGYFMSNRHSVGEEAVIWNLLNEGYAVATMDYRFSHEAIFPAQILDVTAAFCFLQERATVYGIDMERVAVAGQSAGAHLASLMAVSDADPALVDATCRRGPIAPRAVVDLFGPMEFDDISPEDSPLFHKIEQLFGGDLEAASDLVRTANVLVRIDEQTPPFWIVHGDADDFVPYTQSVKLADALGDDRATFVTIEGANHGGPEFVTPALQSQVLDFVNAHLRAPGAE